MKIAVLMSGQARHPEQSEYGGVKDCFQIGIIEYM